MAKRKINKAVQTLLDSWKYIRWDKFDPKPMNCTQMNKKGDTLCDDFITLDTETSWNHDEDNPKGWIYQWALTYQGQVVFGRKPSELITTLNKIQKVNCIGEFAITEAGTLCHKIDVFVHNLSYDYAFIGDWLRANFPPLYKSGMTTQSMLAIAPHSLITYESAGFLFKCSFKLTQKSLAQWGKDMNTPHRKLVGTVDYDAIHYQDSPLDFTDWKYMFYDVIVLDECVRTQLKVYNDDLISLPLTVTGYVRREVKTEYLKEKKNRYKFKDRQLSFENYIMCRNEFSGGLTHGNRHHAERTIRIGNIINGKEVKSIKHRDFRSHYPSQQRAYEFPIGKPYLFYSSDLVKADGIKAPTVKRLLELAKTRCLLIEISLAYAKLKDNKISIPYLQSSKCSKGSFTDKDMILDNGRVLKIGEYNPEKKYNKMCRLVLNEDDLKIILMQYETVFVIEKVVSMARGKLPKYLIDSIDKFFKGKTDYKDQVKELERLGKSGADPELLEALTNLMISKGMLNGIYGMSATDPIRASYYENYEELEPSERWAEEYKTEEDKETELNKFYNNFSGFLDYQFGAWTTSHARLELIKFCMIVGWENVLYCDTDSIFYISNDEIESRVNKQNEICIAHSEKVGAFIVSNKGKKVHYDQFELEKETIISFRFLHAKCYAYETIKYRKDGKPLTDESGNALTELHCVIAGVKRFGTDDSGKKISRESELGSIDNLSNGFVFIHCGGMTKKYVYDYPHTEYINGHETEIASACILMKTTKTLQDMETLLDEHIGINKIHQEVECTEL